MFHRFICDNPALPVPSHWERVNTEEPYQVCKEKVKLNIMTFNNTE